MESRWAVRTRNWGGLSNSILRGAAVLWPQPLVFLLLLDRKEDAITLVMGMAGPVRLEDNDLARACGRAQETGSGLRLPGRK